MDNGWWLDGEWLNKCTLVRCMVAIWMMDGVLWMDEWMLMNRWMVDGWMVDKWKLNGWME